MSSVSPPDPAGMALDGFNVNGQGAAKDLVASGQEFARVLRAESRSVRLLRYIAAGVLAVGQLCLLVAFAVTLTVLLRSMPEPALSPSYSAVSNEGEVEAASWVEEAVEALSTVPSSSKDDVRTAATLRQVLLPVLAILALAVTVLPIVIVKAAFSLQYGRVGEPSKDQELPSSGTSLLPATELLKTVADAFSAVLKGLQGRVSK